MNSPSSLKSISTRMCSDIKLQDSIQHKDTFNLWFYNDQTAPFSYTYTQFISLHSKNYTRLFHCQDYIQWLFPNYYQSNFNFESSPLLKCEAQEFRTNPVLAQKLIRSLILFLDLFGIKINILPQEHLAEFNVFAEDRFKRLCTQSYFSIQILRVVASLSVTGFRLLALDLANAILEKECGLSEGCVLKLRGYIVDGKQFCKASNEQLEQTSVLSWQEISNTCLLHS